MKELLAAVGIALAAAGCSVDEDRDARRDARAAVETFLGACAAGRGEAALDLLSPLQRPEFIAAGSARAGCAAATGLSPRPDSVLEDWFRGAEVADVRVEGGLGVAVARLGAGGQVELDLERAGDAWFLARPGR